MITKTNLKDVLGNIGFHETKENVYSIHFDLSDRDIIVDFVDEKIHYPEELKYYRATTLNFDEPENFVVLECICRLLKKGYSASHIELEKPMPGGHHDTGGYCDIWVSDNNNKTFLLIECKKADEFNKYWNKMLNDGGQLFNYYNSYRQAKALCLYTSDYSSDVGIKYTSHIISMVDNDDYLQSDKKLKSFKDVQNENGGKEEYFKVWESTYQQDYSTRGLFEKDIEAYTVGKLKYTINDLEEVDNNSIQKKYHEFATILRQHNVGSHENAFDKLVNLFLAKIVDESVNIEELQFYWKGASYDDYYSLQDRLQKLYKDGMEKFLGEEVTYIDQKEIKNAFHLFKNDPDATRDKVLEYFRQLKFYTNNDFAFLDVHNETLFYQNAIILKKIVQMLEDIKLKTEEQNQFLGDLFEGFLDQGVKQSEGQYFTPLPIVKFMISSLPLEQLIDDDSIPYVIDYACGAGHFLTEFASEIKPIIKNKKKVPVEEYYQRIYGIEKEYRLSKVSKVSAFMYGEDDINIIYGDALANNKQIHNEQFSALIANPPYSVKGFLETLTDEERNSYELTSYVSDITTNKNIEVFFVERAKQLLKGKGIAAIVLPSTILSNGKIFVHCREILLKYFHIVAIGEFGGVTFGKTNTNTVTLFLKRRDSNPDVSDHYRNRINAWFTDDTSKDIVFEDGCAIEEYCTHCGIDVEEYKLWLREGVIPSASIFEDYLEQACSSTKYKNIEKKKTTKRFTDEDKKKALKDYTNSFIKNIEKDKLYYYLLARSNYCDVIVIKSPTESNQAKQFLGYEWSGAKGNEGIKYLGTKQDGEGLVIRNKGINSIKTPLFDPNDLQNNSKINSLIRKNYSNSEISIDPELEKFVSIYPLVDLMDFSRITFDKSIKTTPVKAMTIVSKYETKRLSKIASVTKGVTYDKEDQTYNETNTVILTADNITIDGRLDIIKKVYLDTKENIPAEKMLKKNDIFMCFSSGSKNHIGKVALVDKDTTFYAGGFMGIIRTITKDCDPKYLFHILNSSDVSMLIRNESAGSNINNLSNRIGYVPIPLPPTSVQDEIVAECENVDKEYNDTSLLIQQDMARIESLFSEWSDIKPDEWKPLKKICDRNISKDTISERPDEMMVSFVEMSSVNDGGYIENKEDRLLGEVRKGGYTYFAEDDIIIAKITPCMENGKCAIATGLTNGIGFGSSEFHVFRCHKEQIRTEFLFGYLNRDVIRQNAERAMTGASGHRRVPITFYEDLVIPVPSLDKQDSVLSDVATLRKHIDELNTKLDGLMDKKRQIMEQYLK